MTRSTPSPKRLNFQSRKRGTDPGGLVELPFLSEKKGSGPHSSLELSSLDDQMVVGSISGGEREGITLS